MRKMLLASIVIISLGINSSSAVAEPYMAASFGGSATDQYAETIPELGGEKATDQLSNKTDQGKPAQESSSIPAENLAAIKAQGEEGISAAGVAVAMDPLAGKGAQGNSSSDPAADGLKFEGPTTGLSGAVSGLSESDFGLLLPLALILTFLGAAFLSLRIRFQRNEE